MQAPVLKSTCGKMTVAQFKKQFKSMKFIPVDYPHGDMIAIGRDESPYTLLRFIDENNLGFVGMRLSLKTFRELPMETYVPVKRRYRNCIFYSFCKRSDFKKWCGARLVKLLHRGISGHDLKLMAQYKWVPITVTELADNINKSRHESILACVIITVDRTRGPGKKRIARY